MKKFIIALTATLFAFTTFAQDDRYIYAEIVGTTNITMTKVTIQIDFGQETKFAEDTRLRDKNGAVKKFNSMVDAMNWMGAMGWEFQQAYVVTIGNSNVYHWLLKKNTKNLSPEELEAVKDAFPTKTDFNQNK